MKYLLITNKYPKHNDLYRNAFVHRRVKNYMEYAPEINIGVFVLNNNLNDKNNYIFDSVDVTEGNSEMLQEIIRNESPKKLLIHFIDRHMMSIIKQESFEIPVLVWIHGGEALGWYRRLFNLDLKTFPLYALSNMKQMIIFREFIKQTKNKEITYIFVSNWMKRILETDTLSKINNYRIIPNSVDNKIFSYQKKNDVLRKKILLIRPFSNNKYANDVAINAILLLRNKPYFEDLQFTIYGEGKHFNLTKKLDGFKNISINNRFLTHKEISEVHKDYGVFLCPTRQDSQGVSMCEAMSSGLVPISSNNTAIPEFIKHKESGLLTNNAQEIALAIEYLYKNKDEFSKLSSKASETITKKCKPSIVINKELELIRD